MDEQMKKMTDILMAQLETLSKGKPSKEKMNNAKAMVDVAKTVTEIKKLELQQMQVQMKFSNPALPQPSNKMEISPGLPEGKYVEVQHEGDEKQVPIYTKNGKFFYVKTHLEVNATVLDRYRKIMDGDYGLLLIPKNENYG